MHDQPASALLTSGAGTARSPAPDHGALLALRSLYSGPDAEPLWSSEERPMAQALALVRVLRDAGAYGLEPQDYAASELTASLAALATSGGDDSRPRAVALSDEAERWAQFDVQLSAAALRLICDLHYGRIDPRAAGFELGEARRDIDLAGVLRRLAGYRAQTPCRARYARAVAIWPRRGPAGRSHR